MTILSFILGVLCFMPSRGLANEKSALCGKLSCLRRQSSKALVWIYSAGTFGSIAIARSTSSRG